MQAEVFSEMPNELKTIEIDTEKKIFNINGEAFGEKCTEFYISCEAAEGFRVNMEIGTRVTFKAKYDMRGKRTDYVKENT